MNLKRNESEIIIESESFSICSGNKNFSVKKH